MPWKKVIEFYKLQLKALKVSEIKNNLEKSIPGSPRLNAVPRSHFNIVGTHPAYELPTKFIQQMAQSLRALWCLSEQNFSIEAMRIESLTHYCETRLLVQ